jgi:LacI family transcriptional regulator
MNDKAGQTSRKRAATVKDVALEAGVSVMTVSRVINDSANVSPAKKEQVLQAIAKVNYRPHIGARALSGAQTYQLLMMFNNPNVAWMGELIIGMMNKCRRIGYHLLIEGFEDFEHQEATGAMLSTEEIAGLIDSSHVDGIILPPPICFDRAVLDAVRALEIPCVRIAGNPAQDINLRVGIDNCAAAYEITDHLISLGHENIAVIKGPDLFVSSALRYEGFSAAMRDHGVEVLESNVVCGHFDVESGIECARDLLRRKNRPTAIFASNDEMAAGVLFAAQEAGIRVPEQLSVAGFDDAHIAQSVWPRLTTIRQPLRAMGEKSVELLESWLRQANYPPSEPVQSSVMMDYELMVRQSTAAPFKPGTK